MTGGVRIGLFGGVTAWRDEAPVPLGPTQQRAVFALLALAGRPLSRDELARALWDDDPPRHAANVIQTHVKHLRHALDPQRAARAPSEVLARAGDGYLLRVDPEEVDALRFRRLVGQAREAHRSGDHDGVRRAAEEALTLWHAPPVADVPSLADHPLVTMLTEDRWALVSWYADVALRGGTPADALSAVEEAAAARPLDETMHGRLIRLYVALGRRADGLGCYERLRRRLAEELGVDPTPELRALHREVLREDAAVPRDSVPRSLPRDLVDFTGRAELLAELLAAIRPAGATGTAPVIQAIDGMPGVGKTALAVHLAHLVADRYPDAQLYIDLHGHSEREPLQPPAALDALLRQLGVPGERIPDAFDQRITLWRGELAGRRTLLLLDNAANAEQVAQLLPAEPGCLTLVTSRRRMAGLDGARPVSLGVLTAEEAVTLQRRIVGDRVEAAPEAAQDVARHCGHLALAIRLAAARLAHRPGWTVADLAARLHRAETPLRELALPGRTVEAAFALSYHDVSEPARRLFRLLGLHRGSHIDVRAAAALADLTVDDADEVLAELVDAHLIDEPSAGRYRLHDLIRDYAATLAATEPEREPAIDRLLTYYLHMAARCNDKLSLLGSRFKIDLGEPPVQLPPPPDPATASAWFGDEYLNVGAAIRLATDAGRDRLAWRLAQSVWSYEMIRGHSDEALAVGDIGLACARRAGEPPGVAAHLNNIAGIHYKNGRWDQALRYIDQAIAIRATLDDPLLHSSSLANKAGLLQRMGDLRGSLATAELAVQVGQTHGRRPTEFGIQLIIGRIHTCMGDFAAAERQFRAMLEAPPSSVDTAIPGAALAHLGGLSLYRGQFAEALEQLTSALADPDFRIPLFVALAMSWLGSAQCALGQPDEGVRQLRRALDMMVEHGENVGGCEVRSSYATGLQAAGDVEGALEQSRQALAFAERLGLPHHQARALDGMADALAGPDPGRSAGLRARADTIYRRMGVVRPVSLLSVSLP